MNLNLTPLFTTARVVTAVYKIASTVMLLGYLVHRVAENHRISRKDSRRRVVREYINAPQKNRP
jgi:hypothetical protein